MRRKRLIHTSYTQRKHINKCVKKPFAHPVIKTGKYTVIFCHTCTYTPTNDHNKNKCIQEAHSKLIIMAHSCGIHRLYCPSLKNLVTNHTLAFHTAHFSC